MLEQIDTPALRMRWSRAPWDEPVCGFPVLQIDALEIVGPGAEADFRAFENERERLGAGLVSCRLVNDRMRESMLLEKHGFRFIEMMFSPQITLDAADPADVDAPLTVALAVADDLPALLTIAGTAFTNERFALDPCLDPSISGRRYRSWVASALEHPTQRLYVIREHEEIVAFFVSEMLGDATCYWHLTAVAPQLQGRGYGRRVWRRMLAEAKADGARKVRTSIAARNHRVLNLYARLGFRFAPPTMTLHWTPGA